MTRKLVTNEEAIKCLTVELGLRGEGYHSYLSHYGKQDKAEEEFLDSLQTAIAALREQDVTDINVGNKWISVEDRLPEDGVRVLTAYDDGIVRLNISKGGFPSVINGAHMFSDVTHWMPLPEPPTEEEV